MTDAASVFDDTNTNTVTDQNSVLPQTNSNGASEFVSQLVGDGKKFRTVEDLAKGKIKSDEHIAKLEAELAQERAKNGNQEKLSKFLEEYEQGKLNPQSQENTTSGLAREDIAEIVRNEITSAELVKTAAQNISTVDMKVKELYGEKAKDFLTSKAKELNLSVQELKEISAKSPSAFFNVVGIKGASTNSNVTIAKGSVNTETDFNKDAKVGSKEYYDNMRKTDKKKYFSAEVQNEIFKKVAEGSLQL